MLLSRFNDEQSTEVIECNLAFARMLGREPADVVGNVGPVIVHPDDLHLRQRLLDDVLAGRPASAELRFKHRAGHDIWALTVPSATLGPDGERLIVLQAVDITERKALESRLQYLADRDALTGLYTRRRFEEELTREIGRAHRHGRPGALLLLDLDGFKGVNDTFGHAAGDEVLIRISAALRESLRHSDVLARLGGDEFALLLPDTDCAAAQVVAGKLVDAVRTQGRIETGGRRADVTASVGITRVSGAHGLGAAQLLIEADMAMYQAKAGGNDRVAVYGRSDTAAA
jgi:diguanylate cyclase (GGDEF)-like protein/PAS domain S-box-containing protein